MPSLDDRLRIILSDHRTKVNNDIFGMIMFGFILGVFFSYTNLLGIIVGFILGIITAGKFEDSENILCMIMSIKKLIIKHRKGEE